MRVSFVPFLFLAAFGHTPNGLAQSAGRYSATGNMMMPRAGHTATLLPNGKVLIAGGSLTLYEAVTSAELYDPSDGAFVHAGNMNSARSRHTATLLPDGKVLIVGGYADGYQYSSPLRNAELYDPFTGTFTATGDMITARSPNTLRCQ